MEQNPRRELLLLVVQANQGRLGITQVCQRVHELLDLKTSSLTTNYLQLRQLEEEGLIAGEVRSQPPGKRGRPRVCYHLTTRGELYLKNWEECREQARKPI